MFALDGRRRCVFFNSGCEQLTGWTSEELTGRTCDYDSDESSSLDGLTGALCPPPEVFRGTPLAVPAQLPLKSGRSLARMIHYFPLMDTEGHAERIVGFITALPPQATPRTGSATQLLHAELASLRQAIRQRYQIAAFVARSAAMGRVLQQIEAARKSHVPVFIAGAAGTGKEHVARTIHHAATERRGSFVPLDCEQVPAFELKQSLRRILDIEPSDNQPLAPRTLYLLNVESLPRDLQESLVAALGNPASLTHPGLQIISSSTIPSLAELTHEEALLPELYFRLTSIEIRLPPLRERRDDLDLLAQHFLEACNRGQEKQLGGFAESTWKLLVEYNWPGNLDELHRVIEEAWELCDDDLVQPQHLPFRFRTGMDNQAVSPRREIQPYSLEEKLQSIEGDLIREMLEQCRYNKSAVAEKLGLTRARLYRRMEQLGIGDPPDS